ncbi:MAG: Glu-tRNA(Gln) amidotransferase subunit GatD [Thaumarchaeota archaeon]|nr:Glu-tRNA(Gln) amidotransferase subunit GatD [Nitrososphaerota archaeon]NSL77221.1 Glu-tRNA(Gln) amidotransferase subunit GatD [Nitrososphaerota archaeon]
MSELSGYKNESLKILNNAGISIGDLIKIITKTTEYSGNLLPRYEYSEENYIVIKLSNGYNIGIDAKNITNIQKIMSGEKPKFIPPEKPNVKESLPKIAILGTGGTIASRIDYKTGAVNPAFSAEELYSIIPELSAYANINTELVSNIASEQMNPEDWTNIAKKVIEKINEGNQGIIIGHGTDTMAYTSAALSFALKNCPIPVIITGAQRSTDRPSSDASLNMISSVIMASKKVLNGVYLAMHSSIEDNEVSIHSGTRVRKNHTSRRDAFQSIGVDPIAIVNQDKVTIGEESIKNNNQFNPKIKFEENISLLKFHPGFNSDIIDKIIELDTKGIILEGTGLGHVNSRCNKSIKKAIDNGMFVGMTSQCLQGRIKMTVYSAGRNLLNIGVIPLEDMLPETALVKLMWAYGNYENKEIKNIMLKNIAGEYTERSILGR